MKKKLMILVFVFIGILFLVFYVNALQISLKKFSTENITSENNLAHLSVSDPSLVLYMPFDYNSSSGTIYDYSKYNNDGTLNGVAWNNSGVYGGDYEFDAISGQAIVASNLGIFNVSKPFTVSAWVFRKGAALGGAGGIIALNDYVTYYDGFAMVSSTSSNNFQCISYPGTGTTGVYTVSNDVVADNQWYHVVCDYNGTTIVQYIDGILQNDKDNILISNTDISTRYLVIGRYFSASANYVFNGSIDEVMVFNRSLSSTEVAQIYNSTYSRFYPTGEMTFENLNFGLGDSINFSSCINYSDSYLQGKVNNGGWKDFTNCSISDYPFTENLTNANLTIKFNSDNYNFYSPLLEISYYNISGDFDFSNALTLTFPPENYSDEYYGAGSNPTGNPIGGFVNYSRIVNPDDADFYVNTKEEFLFALENVLPGQIIYINDSVTLDFTNEGVVEINTENITIASGRGNNYSKGALIKKDIKKHLTRSTSNLLKVYSDNVRFTGLRFDGGDSDCNIEYHSAIFYQSRSDLEDQYYMIKPTPYGISSQASFLEIDNCELYGWRFAAVASGDGALNNYVHHNYIHENCHHGLGYGTEIDFGTNISFLIEANLFNHNRHSVASTYDVNSYEARYNLQFGEKISHDFDRHGATNYSYGGNYTIIHHNSFVEVGSSTVGIRAPPVVENGGQIYNNFVQGNSLSYAFFTINSSGDFTNPPGAPGTNVTIFNNLYNSSRNIYYSEPVAIATANKYNVSINEAINFNASNSYSNESSIRYVEWDFADNSSLVYGNTKTHSFSEAGRYLVKVTVSDQAGFLNSSYLNITVNPGNSSKTYLDFWMFENSLIDSPEYVQKVAMIDNEIVWQQNFSDNVSQWNHINIEIPANLTTDDLVNVTLGISTLENYTDPLYPNEHEVEFFEIYFDQIAILSGNNDSAGVEGDLESIGNWNEIDNETTAWTNEISWGRNINGKYAYKIAPIYRGNYTAGSFVGINQLFNVTKISVANSGTNSNTDSNDEGSPGGSSSSRKVKINVSKSDLENGSKIELRKNYEIEFEFENKTKLLKVDEVGVDKVNFSIDGKFYSVENNSENEIDLDDDGVNDLKISVENIFNGIADIKIELIKKENVEIIKKNNWLIWFLVFIVISGLFVLGEFLIGKFWRKKK